MMAGPRSNFSMLDFPIRFKLIRLLHDGATCEAIAADPDIAAAYEAHGLKPTRSALSRIKTSREYKEITAQRLKAAQAHEADRLAAALLQEQQATHAIGEQAALELMTAIRSNIGLAEDTKEVERLVRCVAALTNPAKDNQIAEQKHKLREKDDRIDALLARINAIEKEHAAEVAALLAEIAELKAAVPGVNSAEVADAMRKRLGLKTEGV